ncbi:MAG TPA: hypothetical protein VFM93_04025 [Candidatus Limnocylindria bacterium]|nr:hypothetical protein [Candidatus Limnocylindria bacterium]
MRALGLAAVVVLAACGGGASPAGTAATSAPVGAAATPASAPTAAATPAPAATPKPPAFADLVGAAKNASYKVTYKWTGTSGGESVAAEQTWYVRGTQSRFDFSVKGQGSMSIFDLAEGAFMCVGRENDQTYKTEWTCLGGPKDATIAQANPGAAFSLTVEDRPDRFDPTFEGTRTIAGQTAQCFTLKDKVGGEFQEGRMCYSAAGIPLLMHSKGAGFDMTFEATAFSTSVTDADFKLPAAPTKFGAP